MNFLFYTAVPLKWTIQSFKQLKYGLYEHLTINTQQYQGLNTFFFTTRDLSYSFVKLYPIAFVIFF